MASLASHKPALSHGGDNIGAAAVNMLIRCLLSVQSFGQARPPQQADACAMAPHTVSAAVPECVQAQLVAMATHLAFGGLQRLCKQ